MTGETVKPLAVVTGAARGIGADVARQLCESGYSVIVAARDLSAAEAHVEMLRAGGFDAVAERLDITESASVAAFVGVIGDRSVEVLVNNAAAYADWSETASTADLDAAAEVMATNLFGSWRVTQALLPALRRAGSARIVNVGSGAGSHGDPQFGLHAGPSTASYAISKAALHALTAKFAVELAGEGIRVNAVDPGLTATAPGMEAMGARPISEGAASVVWATRPGIDAVGGLFRDGQPLAW
jgi:NAD(P)-dependent dehydrogenase (short-subunit alcohol dehydrogenase family)